MNAAGNLLTHQACIFSDGLTDRRGLAKATAFALGEDCVRLSVQTLGQIIVLQDDVVG